MNINRAIARVVRLFVVAYCLLLVRQFYIQVISGPRLAHDVHNPRTALLGAYRGDIVARDGSLLAHSTPQGRVYALGPALAHAVGYASARYGTSGIEAAYDADLAPRPLGNDPIGQIVQLVQRREPVPALRGAAVVTTIEPAVQRALYDALQAYPRGAGVALDPRTGEVLALASVPSFDPARISATFPAIAVRPDSPLLDRALAGLYPPGSTFKIFTAAAGLAAGTVTLESTFDDPGAYAVGNFVVHDNEGEATGYQNLTGAFALSSNVDFAQIALKLGLQGWYDAAARWNLGEKPGFTLPAERDRLPARSTVTPSILAQLAFGQADLLVTPLRMANVTATIAARGRQFRPYLVRAVRDGGRTISSTRPQSRGNPVSAQVASDVRTMMVAVVARGTGTAAALPGVRVAGKTGTATNPAGRSHAWFVAFAPADAPRVAVAIVVENAGYGGEVAAPIARRVIAVALAHSRS